MAGVEKTSGLLVQVIHSDEDLALISLQGRLRVVDTAGLHDLDEALAEHLVPWVALDIAHLHHIDSTGLSVLASAHKRVTDRGARLSLLEPNDSIDAIFRLARLDRLFEIIHGPEADLIRQRS